MALTIPAPTVYSALLSAAARANDLCQKPASMCLMPPPYTIAYACIGGFLAHNGVPVAATSWRQRLRGRTRRSRAEDIGKAAA